MPPQKKKKSVCACAYVYESVSMWHVCIVCVCVPHILAQCQYVLAMAAGRFVCLRTGEHTAFINIA